MYGVSVCTLGVPFLFLPIDQLCFGLFFPPDPFEVELEAAARVKSLCRMCLQDIFREVSVFSYPAKSKSPSSCPMAVNFLHLMIHFMAQVIFGFINHPFPGKRRTTRSFYRWVVALPVYWPVSWYLVYTLDTDLEGQYQDPARNPPVRGRWLSAARPFGGRIDE